MVSLEGTIERITYYDKDSGYTVLRLRPASDGITLTGTCRRGSDIDGLLTVVGNLPNVNPGETLRLGGHWVTHPKHGHQFKSEKVEQILPATTEGIRRYLGSDLINGIGPRIAERIVKKFGGDTLRIIEEQPARLREVMNIGPTRVAMITHAWAEQRAIKNVMIFLQGHGVSSGLAVKIYKQYGDEAESVVTQDPYRLAHDVWGIGFKTADKIAQNLGLPPNAPSRVEAGIAYTLSELSNDGHVYSPEPELIRRAAALLGVSGETVEQALHRMSGGDAIRQETLRYTATLSIPRGEEAGGVVHEKRAVYLTPFFYGEVGVADRLRRMMDTPTSRLADLKGKSLDWLLTWAHTDVKLSEEQVEAIRRALEHKVSIITGGPGTGKTTCLGTLISVLEASDHTVALASPTGRAAKRLREVTGRPAKTIHRLLGFQPTEGFKHNENNPLPTDVLIVDEASMIDILLMNHLLKALRPETHLLLVGDVDQLPSVGAGDVLWDIIQSGMAAVTRLSVIFRQAQRSLIVTNAHRINRGDAPLFPKDADDFFLFQIEDPAEVADWVVDIVQSRMPDRFKLRPLQAQVLAPMYRGAAGVANLNQRLQAVLNPPDRHKTERHIAGRLFRVGDKVMQTRNNYDKDVFNGDIGYLTEINLDNATLSAVFDDDAGRSVTYDWVESDDLVHAFAISVHKSQGSEYAAVVIPILTQHYMMLQRNLLYTAVTRAKKLCVLVGTKKAIHIAVRNDKVAQRYSGLGVRLLRNS